MADNDIVHRRVRNEFREWCVGWGVLRTISQAFRTEGFESGPPVDGGGERRSCFDEYANVIDWADPEQVHRALRVFEEMLSWFSTSLGADWDEATSSIARVLRRDGFELDDDGTITSLAAARPSMPLEVLRDPSAIIEQLDRLTRTSSTDPALAIGEAKSLIEATCKTVLDELDEQYSLTEDVPGLVKLAQRALGVHAEDIAPTANGQAASKKILGSLSGVALGIAELRNALGTGHGKATAVPLSVRHANLAIGSASTFCRFLLETLRDRRAAAGS